ncbi:hypothetical protein G6F40_015785 [Rhizopus arrhizus]|nr:hypothetical protein G6F40_015785 [Rhizopus arrhizus]
MASTNASAKCSPPSTAPMPDTAPKLPLLTSHLGRMPAARPPRQDSSNSSRPTSAPVRVASRGAPTTQTRPTHSAISTGRRTPTMLSTVTSKAVLSMAQSSPVSTAAPWRSDW